jgi:hypothetical protein
VLSLFSGFTTLAGSIIEVWVALEKRKQKQLDREYQRKLQKAQHDHDLLLQRRNAAQVEDDSHDGSVNSPFLERLRVEAVFLSSMGFKVIYEPISDGYGLALPLSENLTLAFWMPPSYPNRAPEVYMRTPMEIEKIEFEPEAWQVDHTIAEVVSALTVEQECDE